VQFDALPAEIRAEFARLQQSYKEESLTMVYASLFPFAVLVQCHTHAERLTVFGGHQFNTLSPRHPPRCEPSLVELNEHPMTWRWRFNLSLKTGEMLEEEEKRLQAKVALQSLFSGGGGGGGGTKGTDV